MCLVLIVMIPVKSNRISDKHRVMGTEPASSKTELVTE